MKANLTIGLLTGLTLSAGASANVLMDFSNLSADDYQSTPALNSFTGQFSSWGIYHYEEGSQKLSDSTATGGSKGVVANNDKGAFFGMVDTVNSDHLQDVEFSFDVDIDGLGQLNFAVEMGAYGIFENSSNDYVTWKYQIDNQAEQIIFDIRPKEDTSATYTFANGSQETLARPLAFTQNNAYQGQALINGLNKYEAKINGAGKKLKIKMIGRIDGTKEAYAFDNIEITGVNIPEPSSFALSSIALLCLLPKRSRLSDK